ncbi:hypothetical protein BDK51DRAFT_31798 [Blyttiomyces helicus]|uniref:Uncharacterized protein n=1 Tax=Blyttiomyces helicus TaxID=388810 RepID=A0A4P9WN85_9FUNG|nr:hypothetical protein BDK51DRAFT_31798 [Blyttiomyces helicus]|eukprot:RKO93523.1 hypothetical protein BDK51DRAFT_31798 [Blyttiomyces helicus]
MYTAASPLQFDVRTGSSKDPSRQKSGHCAHDHANSPACKEEMLADSANTNLEMLGADDACGGRSFEDLEQKWLVNSGTTSTMMADRSFFKESKRISSSLMVGNRCSVHVKGFGPLNTLQLSGGFRHSSNPTAPFNILGINWGNTSLPMPLRGVEGKLLIDNLTLGSEIDGWSGTPSSLVTLCPHRSQYDEYHCTLTKSPFTDTCPPDLTPTSFLRGAEDYTEQVQNLVKDTGAPPMKLEKNTCLQRWAQSLAQIWARVLVMCSLPTQELLEVLYTNEQRSPDSRRTSDNQDLVNNDNGSITEGELGQGREHLMEGDDLTEGWCDSDRYEDYLVTPGHLPGHLKHHIGGCQSKLDLRLLITWAGLQARERQLAWQRSGLGKVGNS